MSACIIYMKIMTHETQSTTFDWIEESYPGASVKRRLTHAFEELTELALKAMPNIDIANIQNVIAHTAEKVSKQADDGRGVAGEIGDMRISMIGIASALGVDEQRALDDVMAANRARSLDERQRREAAKQKLEIFQP